MEELCLEDCDGGTTCSFDCGTEAADCIYHCPCYPGCPSGCEDCNSAFCKCRDYQSNPDFLACEQHYREVYTACIVACDAGDVRCLAACSRDLDLNLMECPCMKNCRNGCPCENYECSQTTTDTTTTTTPRTRTTVAPKTSVLILNTARYTNPPIITDATGRVDTDLRFTFGDDTSVWLSCSLTFQNQHYVFGDSSGYVRQISQIVGCRLKGVVDKKITPFYNQSSAEAV